MFSTQVSNRSTTYLLSRKTFSGEKIVRCFKRIFFSSPAALIFGIWFFSASSSSFSQEVMLKLRYTHKVIQKKSHSSNEFPPLLRFFLLLLLILYWARESFFIGDEEGIFRFGQFSSTNRKNAFARNKFSPLNWKRKFSLTIN